MLACLVHKLTLNNPFAVWVFSKAKGFFVLAVLCTPPVVPLAVGNGSVSAL